MKTCRLCILVSALLEYITQCSFRCVWWLFCWVQLDTVNFCLVSQGWKHKTFNQTAWQMFNFKSFFFFSWASNTCLIVIGKLGLTDSWQWVTLPEKHCAVCVCERDGDRVTYLIIGCIACFCILFQKLCFFSFIFRYLICWIYKIKWVFLVCMCEMCCTIEYIRFFLTLCKYLAGF